MASNARRVLLYHLAFAAFSMAHAAIHEAMNEDELNTIFKVGTPAEVDTENYELAAMRYDPVIPRSKRAGKDIPHHDAAVSVVAFGQSYHMKLERSVNLVHPQATFTLTSQSNSTKLIHEEMPGLARCHYQVVDESKRIHGAVSDCGGEFSGFFLPKVEDGSNSEVFEIHPVPERLSQGIAKRSGASAHPEKHSIIRRVKLADFRVMMDHLADELGNVQKKDEEMRRAKKDSTMVAGQMYKDCGAPQLDVEVRAYVDYKAFEILKKKFPSTAQVQQFILVIMNAINAIYQHPSLGRVVNFVVKDIKISDSYGGDGFSHNGERQAQLISFCKYNLEEEKTFGDTWDLGLLFTGWDIWAGSSHATMGLSAVNGICGDWACVTGEIGVKAPNGEFYPSTGFMAVYVMGHEIMHNLGASHDGDGGDSKARYCDSQGFVMSSSRGTEGETFWSPCTKAVICQVDGACLNNHPAPPANLDHVSFYHNKPGMYYSPDLQCAIATNDDTAYMYAPTTADIEKICDATIKCRGTTFIGEKKSGPAMAGTHCGYKKECRYNECVAIKEEQEEAYEASKGKWTDWFTPTGANCESGCIDKSVGAERLERICEADDVSKLFSGESSNGPNCPGPAVTSGKCDNFYCPSTESEKAFGDRMCGKWKSENLDFNYNIMSQSMRPPHFLDGSNVDAVRACTIYCRKANGQGWASPVSALEALGRLEEAYFPDGTWCHNEDGNDYYCLDHKCTSDGRGARNAPPAKASIPNGDRDAIDAYNSLGEDGKPNEDFRKFIDETGAENEVELDDPAKLAIGPGHTL